MSKVTAKYEAAEYSVKLVLNDGYRTRECVDTITLAKKPPGSKTENVKWNESVTFLAHTPKPTLTVTVTVHGKSISKQERAVKKLKNVLGSVALNLHDGKYYRDKTVTECTVFRVVTYV
jgi:hypothetical protein